MAALPPLQHMVRWEVEEELVELWGIAIPPGHTVVMLKSLLKDTRDTHMPYAKTGLPNKKPEVWALAQRMGIARTGHETVPQLQRKLLELQKSQPETQPARDSDIYNLGRHKGKTYLQIYTQENSYCEWLIRTAIEEGRASHPELQRMANYIEAKSENAESMYQNFKAKKCSKPKGAKEAKSKAMSRETAKVYDISDQGMEKADEMARMKQQMMAMQLHAATMEMQMHAMKDGYTTLESASSVNPLKSQTSPSDWEIAETVQSLTPRSLAKLKNMVDAKSTAME